ncbi:MAG TPA: MFS transporter [Chthoniobacterales bacterium]|jgi:DHA1 family tetracycline resistance protein-like MFS transporter|nr:MFS transporter [Chthoniobacterales bacterium]
MKKSPLASILSIVFIDLVGFGMIIPILPLYAQRFQATEWQIGLLLASYSFMQFLASPVLGWLSDRYGRKPVLLCSLIGSAVGYMFMASAVSLATLFAARILAGISGASVGTASAYIADITPPENRSKRIGLIGAAFGVGFVLGPAIGGILSHFSVVAPFWFAAILSILNAIIMWIVLPEPERHAVRQQGPVNLRETFEQAGSWRLSVITVTYFIGIAGFAIVTVIYAQVSNRRFDLSQSQISYIFVMMGLIGAMIQGGAIGRLAKRFGDVDLAITGFAVMALSMMAMPLAHSIPVFLVFSAGLAMGNSLSQPTMSAIASKGASPALQGRVLGIVQSAGSLGRVFGPVIAGILLTHDHLRSNGRYGNTPFLVGGFIIGIAFVLAMTLRRAIPQKPGNLTSQSAREISRVKSRSGSGSD